MSFFDFLWRKPQPQPIAPAPSPSAPVKLPTMLILRGIAGYFDGKDFPRGALDEPSALAYARARGYRGEVLDVAGATGAASPQVRRSLERMRGGGDVAALYGFSGGGYNIRHVIAALAAHERARLRLLVVLGAPNNPPSLYRGPWELIYRTDPPAGHMAAPKALLAELPPARIPAGALAPSRDLPCLLSSKLSAFPRLPRPQHCICEDDEAAHDRNKSDLGWLSGCDQTLVERGEDGIVPTGGDGGHVEGMAYRRTPSLNPSGGPHGSTLMYEGCNPDQGCSPLVADEPELWHAGKRDERSLVANAFDGLQQPLGLAQIVALVDQMHHGGVGLAVGRAQGFQMRRDLLADGVVANCCHPAGLGMDHPLELIPAHSKLTQLLPHGILRDFDVIGFATPNLGRGRRIGGQQTSIGGIGFGLRPDQVAVGGKARGVHHLDRQPGTAQSRDQRLLVAAGRFNSDTDDLLLDAQPLEEGGDGIGAVFVLGGTAPMPRRLEARPTNVDAEEERIV